LSGLSLGTTYYYRVGDPTGGWSSVYSFTTEPAEGPTPETPLNIILTGDNGATGNSSLVINAILKQDKITPFNFLILSGDLSYANGDQAIWDTWENMIQPLSSHCPYMVAPGNHEQLDWDFIPYCARFTMPSYNKGAGDLYYSYDYLNVHVTVLNAEDLTYYHWEDQYTWLENDLKNVNRTVTPWLFLAWHDPWYCTNTVHYEDDLVMQESYEALLYQYKVDIVLNGHVHAYERTHPVYNNVTKSDGIIYMVDGHGGNDEGLYNTWYTPAASWSAFRIGTMYGFSSMQIYNATHINWTMYEASTGNIIDNIMLIRDRTTYEWINS